MKKLTFWKSLFLLCALIVGSTSAWADAVTDYNNIVSGTKYYIRATTSETDYYLSVPSSSGAGTAVTSKSNATVFVFTGSGTSWTIKIDGTSNYLTLSTSKSNGNVIIQSSAATWTASNNTTKGLLKLAANSTYYLQKNNSGTQFGSYGNTQTDIWLEPAVIESHNVTFSVNGVASAPTAVAEGADITFPADPASIGGKVFMGWTNGAISGNTDTKPTTLVTSAKMGTADITYYAVFAKASGTGGTAWVSTALADLTSDDVFVIVGDNNNTYALSSNGTSSAPSASAVTIDNDRIDLTKTTVTDAMKFKISGNATNGYTFHPNGSTSDNFIYCTDANNGVRVGKPNSNTTEVHAFTVSSGYLKVGFSTPRYIGIYNSQDWRCYTSNSSGNIAGQTFAYFKQTELTTYSEYCTNVTVPATITAAEYATFSCAYATDFSTTGITVYTAEDKETSVALNEVDGGQVPANTPVVLYKAGADGTAINVPVIASADPVGDNDLVVKDDGADVENMYVLANGQKGVGFYPWKGSKLNAGKVYLQGKSSYGNARDFLAFGGTATGITKVDVNANIDNDAPMYNLAGQHVTKSYKGVVIVNGKKMLNK